MPVTAIDHAAIPTADSERFIDFYKRLGFTLLNEEKWRRGESRIFSLQVGENNIITSTQPGSWLTCEATEHSRAAATSASYGTERSTRCSPC